MVSLLVYDGKSCSNPWLGEVENQAEYFLYFLVFLIPFQQRLYKFLRPFSLALIDQKWNVPTYFEVHLDGFISDFVLLGLIFWCFKKMEWRSFSGWRK